jgi:hypothetical protein
MCLGSVVQENFNRDILAVFEGLLGFCQGSFVFGINQYFRVNVFLLNEL